MDNWRVIHNFGFINVRAYWSSGVFYIFAAAPVGCGAANYKLTIIFINMDYKNILTGVFNMLSGLGKERPSAGTKYRLMGVAADITEVAETLSEEVLERVKQEAVLDADVDMDFDVMAEEVLSWELVMAGDDLQELTQQVNNALGGLNEVLTQICSQLERHHSNEEFARLYDEENRRYLSSKAARTARKTFIEWKEYQCYGEPSQEQIDDYLLEKLLHLFEKGALESSVQHIQRAKRYPEEVDFEQLDVDAERKKLIYRNYAALRKLVDWQDGYLVVNKARIGQHFYAFRHEENAKGHRNAFLKYMHKIDMVQQERKKLLEAEAVQQESPENALNYFAPTKNLKVLLTEEWFGMLAADEKRFTAKWIHSFVDTLMASEWRNQIAADWAVVDKRLGLKCMIIGVLKDAGVIRGSYNSIAKLLDMDGENPATLAKYMGMGKKQPFAEWITNYIKA